MYDLIFSSNYIFQKFQTCISSRIPDNERGERPDEAADGEMPAADQVGAEPHDTVLPQTLVAWLLLFTNTKNLTQFLLCTKLSCYVKLFYD